MLSGLPQDLIGCAGRLRSKLAVPAGLLLSKLKCWNAYGCFATSIFLIPVVPARHLCLPDELSILE